MKKKLVLIVSNITIEEIEVVSKALEEYKRKKENKL